MFTSRKNRNKLKPNDCVQYQMYGGCFTSIAEASIAFRLAELSKNKDLLINYKFQVDKVNKSNNSKYAMIIGSDIMYDLNIDLLFF